MAERVGLQPAKSVVTCRLLSSRRFRSFKYGVGSSSSSIFQQQKGAGCDAILVLLLFPSLFAFSHDSPRLTLRFCADDPGTSKRISRANSSPLGGDRGGQRQARWARASSRVSDNQAATGGLSASNWRSRVANCTASSPESPSGRRGIDQFRSTLRYTD
jgi:hypothetical protein